ncbi:hypothetical protein HKX48_001312 [Thoreauomyces humboldtii]|nr:hypothetical protein HKX48_001312 [Thoreauomyces humboldtii]
MLLCASIVAFNGGIFAFFYPYATFDVLVPSIIPMVFIAPINVPGIVAVTCTFLLPIMEFHSNVPHYVKAVLLALVTPVLLMQLTLVPAATFMALSAVGQVVAAFQTEPPKSLTPR